MRTYFYDNVIDKGTIDKWFLAVDRKIDDGFRHINDSNKRFQR